MNLHVWMWIIVIRECQFCQDMQKLPRYAEIWKNICIHREIQTNLHLRNIYRDCPRVFAFPFIYGCTFFLSHLL